MLPPVVATMQKGREIAGFAPGRDEEGVLHPNMIRRAGVVENFGSTRQVCFIPSLPYIPEHQKYERYSSPEDNPYELLRHALWEKGNRLKKKWMPLLMTKKEIEAYRTQEKMKSKQHSDVLLPFVKPRFFAYAQIYNGYHCATKKNFVFEDAPFGSDPNDGLQIVSFNKQAYWALREEYSRQNESKESQETFAICDPAAQDEGTLNYIWNPKFPHPISGNEKSGIGYAAAVSRRFFEKPEKAQAVDLTLSDDYMDWFLENRLPWSDVLKGTFGVEQVRLIARAFPELKGPAKMAWEHHPLLMNAWEEAFDGPDDCDFYELLHGKYAEDQDPDEADTQDEETTKDRKQAVASTSRLRKEPPEPQKYEADSHDETALDETLDGTLLDEFPFEDQEDVEPVTTTRASERTAQKPLAGRAGVVSNPATRAAAKSDVGRSRTKPVSRRSSIEDMKLQESDFALPFETSAALGFGDDAEENVF
jgi:hypothetical protein